MKNYKNQMSNLFTLNGLIYLLIPIVWNCIHTLMELIKLYY